MRRLALAAIPLALLAAKPAPANNWSMPYAGVTRTGVLHVPAACAGAQGCPLLLAFHGNGGTGQGMEQLTGLDAIADAHGFVVLYPDSASKGWNLQGANSDPQFMAAAVDSLAATGLVDPTQVYDTGYSEGGGMAVQTAACNKGLIQGIAIVEENARSDQLQNCGNTTPATVIEFHGTLDTISPFNGGANGTTGVKTLSAQDSAQMWAGVMGCAPAPVVNGNVQTWSGCAAGSVVTFFTVVGGGHTWAGSAQNSPNLGPTAPTPVVSQEIYNVFATGQP